MPGYSAQLNLSPIIPGCVFVFIILNPIASGSCLHQRSALWGKDTVIEALCTVLVLSVMLGPVGDCSQPSHPLEIKGRTRWISPSPPCSALVFATSPQSLHL